MSRVEFIKTLEEECNVFIERPGIRQFLHDGYYKDIDTADYAPRITERRFDLSTMAKILFGKNYGIAYIILLYLFTMSAQVNYISIFTSSFASTIPLGSLGK